MLHVLRSHHLGPKYVSLVHHLLPSSHCPHLNQVLGVSCDYDDDIDDGGGGDDLGDHWR